MKIDPRNIEVIDDTTAVILKKISGEQKMVIAFQMFDTAAAILRANIKERHPEWNEDQIKKEIVRRMGNGPD